MLYKFKLLESENTSKFLGMFGDCIKIRLHFPASLQGNEVTKQSSQTLRNNSNEIQRDCFATLATTLKSFLTKELGITEDMIDIKEFNIQKNMIFVDLPDLSYEIIMSWLD